MDEPWSPDRTFSAEERRQEWLRYYSWKRAHEQLLQVQMLKGLGVERVLEIGPYFGLVTALLDNAGFEVTTMDLVARQFERPETPHIEMDLTRLEPDKLAGHDCIMSCATLEHIPFDEAEAALRAFSKSGARYVLISLPYQGFQLFFQLYFNRLKWREHFSATKFRFLRPFRADPVGDPYGHKWEIGYKGQSLKSFEALLADIGFTLRRRDFSYPSYCVFHLLECPR
jgi:hypothetical protein